MGIAILLLTIVIVSGLFVVSNTLVKRDSEKWHRNHFYNQCESSHKKIAGRVEDKIKQCQYVANNQEDLETLYNLQRKYL